MIALLNKIIVLTLKKQLLIVALVVTLVSYFFYALLIVPQRQQLIELETQQSSAMQKLKQIDDFVLEHPNQEDYLAELDGRIVQLDTLLPSNPDVGDFLIELQQAAYSSQVEVIHISPKTSLNQNGYYEIPVEVGVRGHFFNIVEFIRRSESLARFISMVTVNIQAKQGLLECKIPMVIYTVGALPE